MTSDNIFNNVTSTITDGYSTITTHIDNNVDLKTILSYAIPLSSLIIIFVLMIVFGIRQRHRVLDKWISLKRMRNTNPRFLTSVGLRRDSEFESHDDHERVISTLESSDNSNFLLTTIA
ncbi:hypothetical protein I4U23_024582 [Adineta vaga]|nr:hypothetical protein I4U23_024582 [Adineta vaga]